MKELNNKDLKTALKKENLNIRDKYINFILELVNYLRENSYNIDITAVINYFKLLPDIDIFEFQEMVDIMKTLFCKNKYQYLNIEAHIMHYFYETTETNIYNKLGEKFKNHIIKEKEKEFKEPTKPQLEDINIRITKKEQSFIDKKDEKQLEYLDSILKGKKLEYLKPVLALEIDETKDYLIEKEGDIKEIETGLREIMLENIRKENNAKVNEICILAGKKVKSLAKKIENELKRSEKQQAKMDRELKLIEKKFSKEHRPEFLVGKNAVILTEDMLDKNIENFNEEELELIGEYIRLNANKFKTVISRTMKKAKRKRIDFKRTMKESVSTFGCPVKLYYKKPAKKKTKIICIMDISGSVKKHSKLLSQFIYEISSVFTGGVRSYAFIKEMEDITHYMTNYELTEGYERAMASVPRNYSDYNTAFKMFSESYLKKVDRNTIVIVLGDARNNKNEPGIEYLKETKERAKTIIWLNPDKKEKWNQGDSIIDLYKPYVDFLYEVSTPNELIGFLNCFNL